jgi:Glu-tRNA(Gln) amidotransferase subunit E-like FAD-binding protein
MNKYASLYIENFHKIAGRGDIALKFLSKTYNQMMKQPKSTAAKIVKSNGFAGKELRSLLNSPIEVASSAMKDRGAVSPLMPSAFLSPKTQDAKILKNILKYKNKRNSDYSTELAESIRDIRNILNKTYRNPGMMGSRKELRDSMKHLEEVRWD